MVLGLTLTAKYQLGLVAVWGSLLGFHVVQLSGMALYIYVYIYIYIYICTHAYLYVPMFMYTYIYVYTYGLFAYVSCLGFAARLPRGVAQRYAIYLYIYV